MVFKDDQRFCDVCGKTIPRGVTYHTGYAAPDILRSCFRETPDFLPPLAPEPDGLVRLDFCAECITLTKRLARFTEPMVDSLH